MANGKSTSYGQDDFGMKDLGKNDNAARLGEKIKSISSNVKDNLREGFDDMEQKLEDFGSTLRERGEYMTQEIKDRVQTNPWPFIGGAAVAALAIGFLAGRRGIPSSGSRSSSSRSK